jgi:hypothetical protein
MLQRKTIIRIYYGNTDYPFYNGNERAYNLEAGAGLYYNFGTIKFRYASSAGNNYNQGFYKSIKNSIEYSSSSNSSATPTGSQLFVKSGVANGVRLITLTEINKAIGKTDKAYVSGISEKEDPKGIFKLSSIKNVPGLGNISFSEYYWLASPYPTESKNDILCITNSGNGGVTYFYTGTFHRRTV